MKLKLLSIAILFLLISKSNLAQWNVLNVTGTSLYAANKIYFLDANTGFIVGATAIVGGNGVIAKTTNGGTSWTSVHTAPGEAIKDISFINSTNGFAVTGLGNILKTTNGGASWQATGTSTGGEPLLAIHFPDANNGYTVGGFNGPVGFKTTNGGTSWTPITFPIYTCQILRDVFFTSALVGYCVDYCNSSRIYHTSDGGLNWDTLAASANYPLNCVYFINSSTGFVGGQNGRILKTINGGVTWTPQNYSGTETFYDIKFVSPTVGYAATGGTGKLLYTTNGGANWYVNANLSPNFLNIYSLSFPTANIGYASGVYGTFFAKTTNGGAVGIDEINIDEINVSVFPNPVKDILVIHCNDQKIKIEKINIINAFGEVVYQKSMEVFLDNLEIDLSKISSGIYFIEIESINKRYVRKIAIQH